MNNIEHVCHCARSGGGGGGGRGLYELAAERLPQLALPRLRLRPRVAYLPEQLRKPHFVRQQFVEYDGGVFAGVLHPLLRHPFTTLRVHEVLLVRYPGVHLHAAAARRAH